MACLGRRHNPILLQGLIALWTLWNSWLISFRHSPTNTLQVHQEFQNKINATFFGTTSNHSDEITQPPESEWLAVTEYGSTDTDQVIPEISRDQLKSSYGDRSSFEHNHMVKGISTTEKRKGGHQKAKAKRKKPGHIHLPLKIPFPVFIPSLPKRYVC
jgi:hypothetical protein